MASERSPLILVTGGTGFIGEHLVARLLARGERVRVLSRRIGGSAVREEGTTGCLEIVHGDITDARAVERAVAGAHVVYHLAACARPWSPDPQEFDAVNVHGTAHVCRAARSQGVRRLVHVSTALVNTLSGKQAATPYQRTKRDAEAIVQQFVAGGGDAVIVRPTRVYGPGRWNQANSVTKLIDLYRRGWFRFRIADGDARGNYVYVEDIVEGMILAAESGSADRRVDGAMVYTLGGEDCTLPEFLDCIALACGKRRLVAPLPKVAARGFALAAEGLGHLGIPPVITRDWVDVLTQDRPASSDGARHELGYDPRGIVEGVRETVRWLEAGRPSPFVPPNRQCQPT